MPKAKQLVKDWSRDGGFAVEEARTKRVVRTSLGTAQVEQTITLPADAIITAASAVVDARPADRVAVGDAAQVRNESSTVAVIDLGGLRTVTSVSYGAARITAVQVWQGTQFAEWFAHAGVHLAKLKEVLTERLRVTFDAAVTAAELAADGHLTLPGAPADPELDIAGKRIWGRPGPVRLVNDAQGDPAFVETVDLAAALQSVIDQSTATEARTVRVVFRTAAPCLQHLDLQLAYVQLHQVSLPAGGLVVDADAEGDHPLSLPLPSDAGPWRISGCELTLQARIGPGRVQPAVGPVVDDLAQLILDPQHVLAARLPSALVARCASITGVRLLVSAGDQDAELAGVLRVGGDDQPATDGAPLPGKPVTVPAGAEPTWITLELAAPVKPHGDQPWWIEVTATRGRLTWAMALPVAEDPVVPGQPPSPPRNVLIRRVSPGPLYRPIVARIASDPAAAGTIPPVAIHGALRLVGEAVPGQPIPAVEPRLGPVDSYGSALAPCTPTPAGVVSRLSLAQPLAGAVTTNNGGTVLPLTLRIATPGTYTITAATLLYRLP